MSKRSLAFIEVGTPEHLKEKEEMGYGEPFSTISWARWLEMQASMLQSFTRFQRAIEQGHVLISHAVVRELHGMVLEMQKEADEWIGVPMEDE
ncbi:MAG TPA: hypothetical protein VKR06_32370 [Ktedonosporobacter sp.]|nr:hypothetical protein [Ktedonosporobacter sp.]